MRGAAGLSRRGFLRLSALAGTGALLAACQGSLADFASQENEHLRRLVLIYTNDEHGWLEPSEEAGGAAAMYRRWTFDEGIQPGSPCLVLSGGDLFTGPALSTYFRGQSTIDAMNAMGYAAAAIGNHDFDYGEDVLRQRSQQAAFPLLSANLRRKADGATPDYAQPFVVKEVNGVRMGLIGLTTPETRLDTQPRLVAELDFLPYDETLREIVPQARMAGAELLVVLGHMCTAELRSLAGTARELGIPILCGGHCHEETVETKDGVALVQSGCFWRNYIRIALLYDTSAGRLEQIKVDLLPNPPGREDARIAGLTAGWRSQAEPALWQPVGYLKRKLSSNSPEMAQLITRPWLQAYPAAQAALLSPRYVQSLPAGELSLASFLSMLPTDNQLVDIQLTGAQLVETVEAHQSLYGGFYAGEAGYRMAGGASLDPAALYRVLLPDSLYAGGNYYTVDQYDSQGRLTGLDWRLPVSDWVRSLGTSRQDALDGYLQAAW